MLDGIHVEVLNKIIKNEKPYRGRTNEEYPYWKREHGQKFFRVVRDCPDGEILYYEIHYYSEHVATVYPDNTIEFMDRHYYNGTMIILNDIEHEYVGNYENFFVTEQGRGGVIYKFKIGDMEYIIPIRPHARYDMLNNCVAKGYEYDVLVNKVDRPASNKFFKEYKDKYAYFETWLKSQSHQDFVGSFYDILEEYELNSPHHYGHNNRKAIDETKMITVVDKLASSDNVEDYIAFILLGAYISTPDVSRYCNGWSDWYARQFDERKDEVIKDFKTAFKNSIWRVKNLFIQDKYPCELRYYPTTKHPLVVEFRNKHLVGKLKEIRDE